MNVDFSKAAKLAGVTRQTIHNYVREGRLSAVRVGKRRFIDTSELMRVFGAIKLPEEQLSVKEEVKILTEHYTDKIDLLLAKVESLEKELISLNNRLEHKPTLTEPTPSQSSRTRPEDDPDYPKEIKSPSDLLKRREIKDKYSKK